jgi:hypothetical protein
LIQQNKEMMRKKMKKIARKLRKMMEKIARR